MILAFNILILPFVRQDLFSVFRQMQFWSISVFFRFRRSSKNSAAVQSAAIITEI